MKTLITSPPNLAINLNAFRQTDCAVAPLGGLIMEYYKNLSLELLTCYDDDGNFHIEEFKDIKSYEGVYQGSTFGRVKSLARLTNNQYGKTDAILKPKIDKDGYLVIGLRRGKHRKWVKIHRLVAILFIPNPNNLPEVNHVKEIKTDNRVCELEWMTTRANQTHSMLLKNNTSKYVGVYWQKRSNKWCAGIVFNKRIIYLGLFANEEDASNKYQCTLKEIENGTFVPKPKKIPTSKYKGVYYVKNTKKWSSSIRFNGIKYFIGNFTTELEAHEAYQNKLKALQNI